MSLETLNRHPLGEFLATRYNRGKSSDTTMTGMGKDVKGKWRIEDSDYSEFLDKLHDWLFVQKHRPLNLVEQPLASDKAKPLLIDLDFKYDADSALTRRFTDDNISTFVTRITDALDTFFDLTSYETLRFFVSLRPQPYPEGASSTSRIKDGIHIQCPDITLTNEKQKVLRSWLLEERSVKQAFDGTGYTNADEDVYDESMVRKQGWFFYGESKPSIPAYKLQYVYSYNPKEQTIQEEEANEYTPRILLELLSVRYNLSPDENEVKPEKKGEFEKFAKASVFSARAATAAPPVSAPTQETTDGPARTAAELGVTVPLHHDSDEITLAKELTIQCLSSERADNYKTWMEVGWCLANIDTSDTMFDTWMEFSRKSDKFNNNTIEDLKRSWSRGLSRNTAGSKLTLRSLHYWARHDNPTLYEEIVNKDHIRYVQYKTEDTHFHTAKLLQRIYNERFCASVEQRRTEWYAFDSSIHSWRHTNQGIELREKLSSELTDIIVNARSRLKKKGWDEYCAQQAVGSAQGVADEDWFKRWAMTNDGERFQILTKLEKHLYQSDFKSSVMREAAELFCEEDFLNKLNMNPYLYVCKNGVIDLRSETTDQRTGKPRIQVDFRPGKPDDWMSFVGGRNFPESEPLEYHPYDPSDPRQKELAEFLTKIFPRPELRAYVLRLLASCLEAMNREQCYYTLIGVGGNGKSKLVELMRLTFGDYCSSLQATALTRKRPDSGAANPDIIAIKNKRFIYLQEPDDKEPLNTSRMKQFSGEDIVEARGLFEDQQRFRITGKLFMMCNSLPPITTMDKGTWRRIRVIPFESRFVDPSDPDLVAGRPNVFEKDYDLDKKLLQWREPFLSLLVHIYEKEYCVAGLEPVPAIVLSESEKYKENFDAFGKFKNDRIRKEVGRSTEFKDMWRAYMQWCKETAETIPGKRLNQNELKKRLEDEFGTPEGGKRFRHILVFTSDDDAEAFDRGEWTEE